ncbi:MAG: radical SAM protein [Candidatus Omnitrophota bacterium]
MRKVLLVNPWIYDFAAHDYGIKPIGLLRIGEALRRDGSRVYLVDCLENCGRSKDEFGFSKIRKENVDKPDTIKDIKRPYFRYGISIEEFKNKLNALKDIDEIFVTSGMTYWYPGVQLTIKSLREYFKDIKITLGGIYATLSPRHASLHSGADIIWEKDYLERDYFFKKGFYPAYDLLFERNMLPIQLTQGCPFRCSYCASRMISGGFMLKDPVDLFEEVMHYHNTFGTDKFVFYDDALIYKSGIGIKKFLRMVIASGRKLTFHTPNGLHARFIDEDLAHLFKHANFKELRLSLETSDEDLQFFTGAKVTNVDLKRAIRNLREAGFNKSDLGVYILIGANWLNIDKTMKDILFINSLGVKVVLASYSSIPGTMDYKNMLKNNTLKKDTDPLWHNKAIFSELLEPRSSENIQKIRRFTSKLNKA